MTTRILIAAGILAGFAVCFVVADDGALIDHQFAGIRATTRTANDAIERALTDSVRWDYTDEPLDEVLAHLADKLQINVWIDKQAFDNEGIPTEMQVTLVLRNAALQTGLRLILEPQGLTFLVEDGVVKVTTISKAEERMATTVYPVPDLLGITEEGFDDYLTLISAIEATTTGRWEEIDGEGGAISPVPVSRSLVIRQTWKVHREIAALLAALRRAKGLPNIAAISAEPSLLEEAPFEPLPEARTTSRSRPARAATTRAWQQPRIYSAE